jgi:hypothetical protein
LGFTGLWCFHKAWLHAMPCEIVSIFKMEVVDMKTAGKVIGLMFLFFWILYLGEALFFNLYWPNPSLGAETQWRVMLGSVFEAGLITCFVLYILAVMEKDKQEIMTLLKSQTLGKCATPEVQENMDFNLKK